MNWEMIGHKWAIEMLRRHIETGQVRHAYLFTGPDHVGKRTLALRFAQALNCEDPPSAGEACRACRSCKSIDQETHPDLHLVGSEQIGGTLGVDQIRELQRRLSLSAYQANWKVAVLLRFHEASISAANALLKTLEEPPAHVVMLVTARRAEDMPATVGSRCERIHLRRLPNDQLEAALIERGEAEDSAYLLARVADGRPGMALRLSEEDEFLQVRTQRLDELIDLMTMNRSERFAYVERITRRARDAKEGSNARTEANEMLQTWVPIWRECMLIGFGARESSAVPDREADILLLTEQIHQESVIGAIQAIERTQRALARNANLRLALETLMLDLPRIQARD